MSKMGNFYVYVHRDKDGKAFYVGKGTDRRAWSESRHPIWHKYVNERLGGVYEVEIVKSGLTEEKALELEDELIAELGATLVNWINMGRQLDYSALNEYHRKRDANLAFIEAAKSIEKSDLAEAIRRYFQAMASLEEYEAMTLETGVVADLMDGERWGDLNLLNRLTLCLDKAKRHAEMVEVATQYFAKFPKAKQMASCAPVLRRLAKANSASNAKP